MRKLKRLTAITLALTLLLLLLTPVVPLQAYTNTIDRQVASDHDDCVVYWDGSWQYNDDTIYHPQVGYGGTTYQKIQSGIRFTNINIPRNTTIEEARIELCAFSTDPLPNVATVLRGEDIGNASAFTDYDNFQGRSRTTAYVEWAVPSWTKDIQYNSPNIKTILQEIVNRGDWDNGNDIVIFWGSPNATSGTRRAASSYDSDASRSAILHIEYTSSTYTDDSSNYNNDEIEELINDLSSLINDLGIQIDDMGSQSGEPSLVLSGLTAQTKTLKDSITALQGSMLELNTRLSSITSSTNTTGSKVDALTKKVDSISAELTDTKKIMTGTLETKTSAMERDTASEKRFVEIIEAGPKTDSKIATIMWLEVALLALLIVMAVGTAMRSRE